MSQRKTHGAPITRVQVTLIHVAKGELGIDDDTYRDMLQEMFGAGSSKDLSAAEADDLLEEFKARGFRVVSRHPRPAKKRPQGKNVVHLASAAEIDKLNAVASLIRWRVANGLALFLEKRLAIKGGRVRTAREAYLAIEALKKMFENGMVKAHGPEWWTMRHAPEIEEYIHRHAPAEFRDLMGKVYKR
ncbi:hypothetical protein DSOUD_0851 [Desulfuromonas soudanensis]|uniref:Mu-like prophage protein gp16 n=1 Tax=Desulfuromonas soudanensis TaxID=1603606 RepID=A0A0M4D0Y3_9BACT|nr:regulatory protein GemA [Desulfuromonas soudanensis]ALC15638.1 hypothetical protein DSOUD_0851 [Desulfuromonas soudanensis]